MNVAQNDSRIEQVVVAQAVAGYEVAVAEFEREQSALDEARYHLDRATAQLEYARVCLEESDAELELVVMEFNARDPDAPDYYELMAELDLASDTMLRNTEHYEKAAARHKFATEKFESELASTRETLDIAYALRGELWQSVQDLSNRQAANDPQYHPENVIEELSDSAYRFYRQLG